MLQYDNSAFYFFALSSITFYIFPSWIFILSRTYNAFVVNDASIGAVARTTVEEKKAQALKKEKRGLRTLQTKGFLINLAITLLLSLVFGWLLYNVMKEGVVVNSFDPYHILQIDHGSDAKAIKKAYRALSLLYHPDKNPNNRAAAAKFMMVSKAYESLTDDTARENYEKYGNPDGKQSLEVSIGLPDFLLESSNRNLVLVFYLFFMVGLVPWCVYTYYSDSSKYGEKNVMYDTYAWFHNTLDVNTTTVRQLPEIVSGAAEFRKRNLPTTAVERDSIGSLLTAMKPHMNKPKWTHPVLVKGNVLLHCYLLRKVDVTAVESHKKNSDQVSLDAKNMDDLKFMLRYIPSLTAAMMSVCKNMDALQTACQVIEFGQYITQAMWTKDSVLLQIPHFTAAEVSNITAGKKKAIKSIADYAAQDPEERKGLTELTPAQQKDVTAFLKIYPNMTVSVKVFVDDDEDSNVYEGDLVTIRVTVTRKQLDENDPEAKVDLVHAPRFPYPRRELLWIILGQVKENKIITIDKVADPRREVVHDIKFMAPPKGKYHFDLLVKSNGYLGVDLADRIEMDVSDNSALPEYKVHPDDARLDDEPTLFEEMLNAHIEQADSDDEEEDSDDDEGATGVAADDKEGDSDDEGEVVGAGGGAAAAQKRALLRKARNADDDSDDEDDNAQEVYAEK